MPNQVVPTFFNKTVSFTSSTVLEDTLTESITLSVTPVMTNRAFQVTMSTGVVLEDMLSEEVNLSFNPTIKILEPAASTTSNPSTSYQYWTLS